MQNNLIHKEEKIKANALKLVNFSFLFFVFIFLISFSSASMEVGIDGSLNEIGINFDRTPFNISEQTVNNSQYFDGYSVSSLWTYYSGLGDALWCELTGCTMSGDINMGQNNITNADLITSNDFKIEDMTLNGGVYNSVHDWASVTQSSGKISGGTFTSNGDGTVNISSGSGMIRETNSDIAPVLFFDWSENSSLNLIDQETNYIHVDYHSGNPEIHSTTDISIVNNRDSILLGKIFREGNDLHEIEAGMVITEATKRTLTYFTQVFGEVVRASGAVVSETGTLNLASTSGVLFAGLTRLTTASQDTSGADTFEYYYYNSTDWIEDDESIINNSYYNDVTSGLDELTPNRYGVHWVYIDGDIHGGLMVVYGQGDYTLVQAELAQPPSSLPPHVADLGFLAGKIIIKKGATSFLSISSAYDTQFTPSGATEHNELSGLQGGQADEYFHLTSAEYGTGLANQFLPYTGATANVDIGNFNITATYFLGNGSQLTGLPETDLSNYWNSTELLNGTLLKNIIEDTTPQLGGNLDGQAFNITTTGTITAEKFINNGWKDAEVTGTQTVQHDNYSSIYIHGSNTFADEEWTITIADGTYLGQQLAVYLEATAIDPVVGSSLKLIIADANRAVYTGIVIGTLTTSERFDLIWDGNEWKATDGLSENDWSGGKGAFASGVDSVASGSSSTAMGDSTIASGLNSFATGHQTTASGSYSTAMGRSTTASGELSMATGEGTTASAVQSMAMNKETTASGAWSIAMGRSTNAIGVSSTSMGYFTNASSLASTALGRYNIGGGTAGSWVLTDPLFEIGIGTSSSVKNNAFTVRKNGNVEMPNDNAKFLMGAGLDASFYYDGTNMIFNSNESGNGIAWFSGNVSVDNLIDRSIYWDDDLGKAFEYSYDTSNITSDEQLKDFDKITYEVTDFDRPINESFEVEICNYNKESFKEVCNNVTMYRIIYPYQKNETGRLISAIIGRHDKALYEANMNINFYENLTDFDTGIIAEEIFTQSKTIDDGINYFDKLKDKDSLKEKETHFSLVENVMGTNLDGLSVEDRIVELEGFANQMIILLCERNVLKKEDGCP